MKRFERAVRVLSERRGRSPPAAEKQSLSRLIHRPFEVRTERHKMQVHDWNISREKEAEDVAIEVCGKDTAQADGRRAGRKLDGGFQEGSVAKVVSPAANQNVHEAHLFLL